MDEGESVLLGPSKATISTNHNCNLYIYTVTGQLMGELDLNFRKDVTQVDIANYSPGVYFYKIVRNGNILTRGNLAIMK